MPVSATSKRPDRRPDANTLASTNVPLAHDNTSDEVINTVAAVATYARDHALTPTETSDLLCMLNLTATSGFVLGLLAKHGLPVT